MRTVARTLVQVVLLQLTLRAASPTSSTTVTQTIGWAKNDTLLNYVNIMPCKTPDIYAVRTITLAIRPRLFTV